MNFLSTISTFSSTESARLSGLTPTMLDYLCREKFVRPSGSATRGRGHARRFTFEDLIILVAIARLLRSGVEVRRLSKGLRALRGRLGEAMTQGIRFLVTDGKEVYLHRGGTLESLAEHGQLSFAFLIDLHACEQDLTSAIARASA